MEREKTNDDAGDGDNGGGGENDGRELLGLKLRRGVVLSAAARSCGPHTPPPAWKMEPSSPQRQPFFGDGEQVGPSRRKSSEEVSARKLGANLWEIQKSLPAAAGHSVHQLRRKTDQTIASVDRPQSADSLQKHIASSLIQQHKLTERNHRHLQPAPSSYSGSMEVQALNQVATPSSSFNVKGRNGHSFRTSSELLKFLNRIWSLEEQHVCHVSLVKDLKVELQNARSRIKELTKEKQTYRSQIEDLMSQVAEGKLIRKNKEHDKIKLAVEILQDELENERRLRKCSESVYRKLGKELSEATSTLSKSMNNLEKQMKANYVLEELCDEFAKGIKNYEEEVRDLKLRCGISSEPKSDRLILHISDAWLDERMQMSAANNQGSISEKDSIVDRLASEIGSFLHSKQIVSSRHDVPPEQDGKKDDSLRRESLESVHLNGNMSAPRDAEDDSISSELHCFELNMVFNQRSHEYFRSNGVSSDQISDSTRKSDNSKKKKGHLQNITGHDPLNIHEHFEEQIGRSSSNGDKVIRRHMVSEAQLHNEDEIDRKTNQVHVGQKNLNWNNLHRRKHIIDDPVENSSEISKGCNKLVEVEGLQNNLSWRGHFVSTVEGNTYDDFHGSASPVRKWPHQHMSPEIEISGCPSKLPRGIRENTLRAKLLEARLESRRAHLKGPLTSSSGLPHQ